MARKKTLGSQINALHSERLAAIDVFTRSAAILEETAVEYQALADLAYEEAHQRTQLATDATTSAAAAWDQARRIRELVAR